MLLITVIVSKNLSLSRAEGFLILIKHSGNCVQALRCIANFHSSKTVKRDIIIRSYQFSSGEHELCISFFRVYKRSIRVLSVHRIVSFVCRYTANVRVNVNVVSLYLSCYTSYIVRDFAKRSTGISTRRFARTLTFVRKFYQFDNIVQRVSREG